LKLFADLTSVNLHNPKICSDFSPIFLMNKNIYFNLTRESYRVRFYDNTDLGSLKYNIEYLYLTEMQLNIKINIVNLIPTMNNSYNFTKSTGISSNPYVKLLTTTFTDVVKCLSSGTKYLVRLINWQMEAGTTALSDTTI
jgi:hypothetical protein